MERFDHYAEQNGVGDSPEENATSNGQRDSASASAAVPSPPPSSSPVKRHTTGDGAFDPPSASPPAKKRKPDDDVDADAVFAAKLQAEENSRARPTRGGNTRRAAPSKKKSKAKTTKRVKASDDSDIGSGDEPKKEVNRNTGFHVCDSKIPSQFSINSHRSTETAEPFRAFIRTSGRSHSKPHHCPWLLGLPC
jgi:upstream activation factor subunit UAF30